MAKLKVNSEQDLTDLVENILRLRVTREFKVRRLDTTKIAIDHNNRTFVLEVS